MRKKWVQLIDYIFYQGSISLYLKENRTKPFKGKYLFKFVN